jgi:hypothetical protein
MPRHDETTALSPGQLALGTVLIRLPRHPSDVEDDLHEAAVVSRFRGVPDEVLILVAEEIASSACRRSGTFGRVQPQPSPGEVEWMVRAALRVGAELRACRRRSQA